MGRAINQDNRLDDHERRIKLIEDALEERIQTKVHHVDLHSDLDKHEEKIRGDKEYIDRLKEEKLKEEEFTPPVGKRKKVSRKSTVIT
mgnify:CR=1 FL=1